MRATRVVAGLATIMTAALGLSLATASPAAAATGTWRPYGNTNPITSSTSTWKCAPTKAIATNVSAQVCAIRSAGGTAVQSAVIVRNNRSSLYSVGAKSSLYVEILPGENYHLDTWECPSSGVGANSWSVCFGDTRSTTNPVKASGSAGGVYLSESPWV